MSRFLFVVPPFAAHVNPSVSIGQELAQSGHAVAWVTYPQMQSLLSDGAVFYPVASTIEESVAENLRRQTGAPWLAGMKALFEQVIVPLAHDMLPAVEAAVEHFRPDMLIVDQQALAGALAARRRQIRWVTSAPSAALLRDSLVDYPRVKEWMAALFDQLQRDAGLTPIAAPDCSPDLVILYSSRLLAGENRDFPAHYRFVGPALVGRPESAAFPWHRLHDGPVLLVTLGTLFAEQGRRFFGVVVEALADTPLQVVVSAQPGLLPSIPDNFIVQRWVPLTELFPRFNAVLCHAGTIVNEALAHGIPAIVAPFAHEQSIYAQLVAEAGAAVRVRFNRVTAMELRRAVFEVLDNPGYAAAARRVQASLLEAGGARGAAAAIEQLNRRDQGVTICR